MAKTTDALTRIDIDVPGLSADIIANTSVKGVTMVESLLTPGLQTTLTLDSYKHNIAIKDYDEFKNAILDIEVFRPLDGARHVVSSRIYRMAGRKNVNDYTERFTLHACDQSLLIDATNLVSKSWKCTNPDVIVNEILRTCLGALHIEIAAAGQIGPPRDYIAQNIHPFQVLSQQATVAIDTGGFTGGDPSFLHYMTYENMVPGQPRGTHHFKSLSYMIQGLLTDSLGVPEFTHSVTGGDNTYDKPDSILSYSFPCDFDLLSDLLNGVDYDGDPYNAQVVINAKNKMISLIGNDTIGCGFGMGPIKTALTNAVTATEQDSCDSGVEQWLLLRQARMNLLEQDKIAFRCTVPWRPDLHVGELIKVNLPHRVGPAPYRFDGELYGSDYYIIAALVHNILNGGYSTTTLDCIAHTAGTRGEL